ncbi:MAG: glycerophosphoryl diester phosphodiesterase [Deltaproteobacteria bacterium]|jgi:glycerophosphoryl diester phosphodiesterase|nr:MAG: glycerophosphoryl diester phosphodiesterase [Deltaproteobacteria bacterium]
MDNRQFRIIAHRGASAYEPENTLLAFKRAIDMKADMIELDVRMSRDGYLVVIHDSKVDRTTNGYGSVKEKTLYELKKLDAGKGEKIPTLEEVIEFAKGKTKFVVELKERGTEEKTLEIIGKHNLLEDVFIVSFQKNIIKRIKEIEPAVKTGLIVFFPLNPIKKGKEVFADAIAPFRLFVTKRLAEKVRKTGLFLFTWTVDNPLEAQNLMQIGIDGIVTNKPDIMTALNQ